VHNEDVETAGSYCQKENMAQQHKKELEPAILFSKSEIKLIENC
jgi:hypothetical protein